MTVGTLLPVKGIAPNHYTIRSMQFDWQTDPFIWIASGQVYP